MRWLLAVALLWAWIGVARADDEAARKARAKALIEQGQSRYDLGKFDQAIELFEQAYEVYPFPEALYNLGQCWRKKKDPEKAAHYYRAYLRQAPDAPNRDFVEGLIAELEGPQTGPATQPAAAASQATGTQPGNPVPPDDGARDRPRRSRPPWYADSFGWTVTGVGLATLGVGGWYLWSAADLRDQVATAPDEFERMRLRTRADDRESIGLPTTIAGGVVLAGGVALLIWNPSRPVPAVAVSDHATWVLVGGAF